MPHRLFATSFGPCGMAWEGSAVTGFQLPEKDESATAARLAARDRARGPDEPPPAWLQRLVERVQAHLAGRLEDFADVPLDWTRVSDFQRAVYRQTQAVKAGHKRSYGEVARALALGPESARRPRRQSLAPARTLPSHRLGRRQDDGLLRTRRRADEDASARARGRGAAVGVTNPDLKEWGRRD